MNVSATSKHYDVVVLGAGLGALVSAALLARRSWRVLVLGQGHRRATYTYDGMTLARRPFTFLSASSPAWGRVLVELAQSQTFRRRLSSLDPMLQLIGPDLRLDVPPDTELFGREIDREFPAARRVIDDLYTDLARVNAAADAAFERDVVWPPGTFWERRETTRVAATLPYLEDGKDFLAELAREHPFRAAFTVPARFASDLEGAAPSFAVARLHGAWTRGVARLAGGEEELVDFLLERVRAHGGEARLGDRAASITVKGGKVRAVQIDGEDALVGVTFVVSDLPTGGLLELAPSFPARGSAGEGPVIDAPEGRFVVSLVVRSAGLPRSLATESFVVSRAGLAVHLQRLPGSKPDTELLVAEAIVPSSAPLDRGREEVLTTLLDVLPFLERHLLVCDSPHDGRPLWDFREATASAAASRAKTAIEAMRELRRGARAIERALLRATGGSLEAEPMVPRLAVTPPQLHGLGGEPLRSPLGNAFVVGKTTLPALGQEGELLAAWSVARIITRTDRRKEKMLREMWSKVELS